MTKIWGDIKCNTEILIASQLQRKLPRTDGRSRGSFCFLINLLSINLLSIELLSIELLSIELLSIEKLWLHCQ